MVAPADIRIQSCHIWVGKERLFSGYAAIDSESHTTQSLVYKSRPIKSVRSSSITPKHWITPEVIRAADEVKNLHWLRVNLRSEETHSMLDLRKVTIEHFSTPACQVFTKGNWMYLTIEVGEYGHLLNVIIENFSTPASQVFIKGN
ncbi:hypothetical protein WA026_011198 [Henosepilachna vigintioctopunctata]|uniref:Uncharacterized protein n=1 Tax=Henosepilachna vigintioctopunctata TaxID=420089 RepID=A0AAW1U837_9CUCU